MTEEITIKDLGPIVRLSLPVLPSGGVVTVLGRNGLGKTHALDAVAALTGGDGSKLQTRDGALSAQVEGLKVHLSLGRRLDHSGELELEAIDGTDPSALVDPGLKDGKAADSRRIRALLRLMRAHVEPTSFAKLLPGGEAELREICRPSTLEITDDVPGMAAAVKADFEKVALALERAATNDRASAAATREALKQIGGTTVVAASPEAAGQELIASVREHQRLVSVQQEGQRLVTAAFRASDALTQMGERGTVSQIESLETLHKAAFQTLTASGIKVHELQEAWQRAKDAHQQNETLLTGARNALALAVKDRELRIEHERVVAAGDAVAPSQLEAIEAATARQMRAQEDSTSWAQRTRAQEIEGKAAELEDKADAAANRGAKLRQAAAATETVVIEVLATCDAGLTLRDGRLYLTTDRPHPELFTDLSHGERWRFALGVAVKALGKRAVLVARQEAWESLDPINRTEVAKLCREFCVTLYTAQADEGELRAEVVP